MSESTNRFVGRESESRRLEGFISDIASGGQGLLVIEAPSGGGKSLFLQKNLSQIGHTQIEVISGQGVQMSAMTPGYILSGLSKYLLNADQWSKPLREHIQYYFEDITRIFPGISLLRNENSSGQDSTDGGLNFFALNRIATCLAKIFSMIASENRPVLLVLDDFQWADELSKQTIKMWLESESKISNYFGVIVCCRKENAEQLSYLKKELVSDHIELRPFTAAETTEYLRKFNLPTNPVQVESIVSLTAGNPFAIHFLATDISAQKKDTAQPTATLAATICRHFFALNKMQQVLLLHLAVFGKRSSIKDLAEIVGITENAAYTELSDANLRILVDITGPFLADIRFNHDKIREALLSQLAPGAEPKYHEVIAQFLEKQNQLDFFKLAYHFSQASLGEKAIHYSLKAAEEAFGSASYDLAIQNFQIALSFILSQDQRRADVLARLGEAKLLIGRYEAASKVFKEAIECCEINLLRSEYTGKLGEIEFKQGNIATATELTEKALAILNIHIPKSKFLTASFLLKEVFIQAWHTLFLKTKKLPQISGKDALTARLLSRLAYCYWFGKGAIYCGWAHVKELNLVERYADSLEKAQAYSEHAPVMTMIPWFERGINYSYQSMKIRETLNSRWGVGQSKGFLGVSLYGSSRYQETEQVCSEAFETLVKEGDMWEANTAGWNVGIALYRQGRLKEAISQSQKIFNRGKSLNDNQSAAICLGIIGKASDGQAIDIHEVERIERLNLTDAHALAELSIAKATYLAYHKRYDAAVATICAAKDIVTQQGLRQEYVTPLWPWAATMLRLKIQKTFLTPAETKENFKLLKTLTQKSLAISRFYKNNLPHALREEAYRLHFLGQKKKAMATLQKSLEVAVQQKAQWEVVNTYELWKVWGKDLPDHVQRKMAFEIDKIIDADNFVLPENQERNNTEQTVGYFLNEISHIKTPRDGLEKLYHFTSHLSSLRRSVGVVECFSNSTSHDFLPILETQGQRYKTLTSYFEQSMNIRESAWTVAKEQEMIVILPVRRQANFYGFIYVVCSDELAYAEFKIEQPQIETLIRLVASAIEQRQQSTQIQLLNQDLALRIKNAINLTEQKNAELVEAEKQAQLASKAKSEFLANMSHEIRTPLNGVMGTISLLRGTQLTKDQTAYLEALESSSENLYRIVNDILDLSKIEAGRQTLQHETLWLSDLVLQSCDLYRGSAEKKNIALKYDIAKLENVKVIGDPLRIRQIISNLITNAIKFTDSGSVTVRGTNQVATESVKYRIEIIDTGVGIAETDYKKLFQNFSQLDGSSKKKAAGTGLGLSICQKLVELMNGEIGLISEKDKGSTFWFEITLRRELEASQKIPQVKSEMSFKWEKLKVLVAEDNHVNQMIIRKMLEGLKCEVTITENGEKFIERIKDTKFDLAFLDCQMPLVDGFDACKRLRAENVQTPPIIALTAYALESDRQRCFDAGMDDYLAKPVKVEVIKEMMEKWFDRRYRN